MRKLYVPMLERQARGSYQDLHILEEKLSEEDYDRVIFLMNVAFDAGGVEEMKRGEKK